MRGAKEIKRALNTCMLCTKCEDCPYNGEGCTEALAADAIGYIWRLETEIERLGGSADGME